MNKKTIILVLIFSLFLTISHVSALDADNLIVDDNDPIGSDINLKENAVSINDVSSNDDGNTLVDIDSNEARELIESKRKASNDDTWSTGTVRIAGKSKDGYYWISYEEIKSDGATAELTMLFHRENGAWIFEAPSSDYDFNKHDFKGL